MADEETEGKDGGMTGEEVKAQLFEERARAYLRNEGCPEHISIAIEALAPCVVLTAVEAALIAGRLYFHCRIGQRSDRDYEALELLTPPEYPSVPADHLADVQEEMADKALDVATGDDPVLCYLCGKDTSLAMIVHHLVSEHGIDPAKIANAPIINTAGNDDVSSTLTGGLPSADVGPPAPGEGDDLPNPEQGMEC